MRSVAFVFAAALLFAGGAAAAPAVAGPKATTHWVIESETDKFTDKKTVTATVLASAGGFFLSCELGGKIYPQFVSFDRLTLGRRSVFSYRFDEEPVESELWFTSTYLIEPLHELKPDFLDRLAAAQRLRIRTAGLSKVIDADFDVRGARAAIERLTADCALPSDPTQ